MDKVSSELQDDVWGLSHSKLHCNSRCYRYY